MSEKENRRELRRRLFQASDKEEVRAILGSETTQEEIDRTWREIEAHRPAAGLDVVDDDELEAVSGGARNYGEAGCASTTENEWCWANDHCNLWVTEYTNFDPCPKGKNHDWFKVIMAYDSDYSPPKKYRIFECRKCKEREKRYDDNTSNFNTGELQ